MLFISPGRTDALKVDGGPSESVFAAESQGPALKALQEKPKFGKCQNARRRKRRKKKRFGLKDSKGFSPHISPSHSENHNEWGFPFLKADALQCTAAMLTYQISRTGSFISSTVKQPTEGSHKLSAYACCFKLGQLPGQRSRRAQMWVRNTLMAMD